MQKIPANELLAGLTLAEPVSKKAIIIAAVPTLVITRY